MEKLGDEGERESLYTQVTDLIPVFCVFIALSTHLLPNIYGTSSESHGWAGVIHEFVWRRETSKKGLPIRGNDIITSASCSRPRSMQAFFVVSTGEQLADRHSLIPWQGGRTALDLVM